MSSEDRLRDWLQARIASLLGLELDTISLDLSLDDYGLDSIDAVLISGELEEVFHVEVDPNSFVRCDSLEALVVLIASMIDEAV